MASILKVDKLDPQSGTALEIGSSGDTITVPSGATIVNSGTATGFGVGKIGQVLRGESSTSTSISTTTYSTISLSQDITCSATDSKVLIMGTVMSSKSGTNTDKGAGYRIRRDTTDVFTTTTLYYTYDSSQNSSFNDGDSTPFFYIDSPSSTSAITYSIYCATWNSGTMVFNSDGNQSSIVLMEILA